MSKMHYFSNKFSKSCKALGAENPWIFDFDDLKLRDLAKLWVFILIVTKSNLQKSVISSFQWCRRYYVTEKCHQTNASRFSVLNPIKISGYASGKNLFANW